MKVKVAQSWLTLQPGGLILQWSSPSPEDLPNPGIEPRSPTLQANSLLAELQGKPSYTAKGNWSMSHGHRVGGNV